MEKNLYIDASHPDETRIVLKSNSSIEEYVYEDKNKVNFKNNIYLGIVGKVEPSLQAAFINFGRVKHGFLAFNDIQSDYYQIPTEDKDKLQEAEEKIREDLKNTNSDEINNSDNDLSVTALPAIIISSDSIEILLKLLVSLITTPSNSSSVINVFEPPPKTKIFVLFSIFLRNLINSLRLSAL